MNFPNPVQLLGQPFTLALSDDTASVSGLEGVFGDGGPARLLLGDGGEPATFRAAWEAGALSFAPVPLASGAGAVNVHDTAGHVVGSMLIGKAR